MELKVFVKNSINIIVFSTGKAWLLKQKGVKYLRNTNNKYLSRVYLSKSHFLGEIVFLDHK